MTEGAPTTLPERDLLAIKALVWGTDSIKPDIFRRWSQGFYYSQSEPSALEQGEGGPCSIIAPIQAFILKNLLREYENLSFRDIDEQQQNRILTLALTQVLTQCTINHEQSQYYLVDLAELELHEQDVGIDVFHSSLRIRTYNKIDHLELEKIMTERIGRFKAKYGLLLFMYSVIMTKGIDSVRTEQSSHPSPIPATPPNTQSSPDLPNAPPNAVIIPEATVNSPSSMQSNSVSVCTPTSPLGGMLDPWIDGIYGYGSQSLINLMLTGRAVTYVWDEWQDVDGLRLLGLDKQAQVGYITLMEHLRYCTVGGYYKNPVHPVWVLGSETHLTVLFSDDRKIVSPETKSEQARRVFKSFDKDGNNFIKSEYLQPVLAQLDLVSDTEYVEIMKKKLDNENFGIILLNAFMEEFFPREENSTPDMFRLVHYNGLAQSNINGYVTYHIGSAILLEGDIKSVCDSNPMLTCLQTKWPTIEVTWCDNVTPSLN